MKDVSKNVSPKNPERKKLRMTNTPENTAKQSLIGIIAMICWVSFFGLGALVDSLPSRIAVSPMTTLSTTEDKEILNISFVLNESDLCDNNRTADISQLKSRFVTWSKEMETGGKILSFITCVTCYTPLNLCILSIFSGIMGGYYYFNSDRQSTERDKDHSADSSKRTTIAGIRGLLVYISLTAMLYILVDAPFKTLTQSQYFRIAGTFSALAFAITYYSYWKIHLKSK